MSVTRRDFLVAIGAVVGTAGAMQFERQLDAMTRTLRGPQEWTLSFDDKELTDLIRRGIRIGSYKADDRGRPVVECTLEFETAYLWALATLTAPNGDEWRTVDGENWTCGDRRMML